jgi:hypothetical protein
MRGMQQRCEGKSNRVECIGLIRKSIKTDEPNKWIDGLL